MLRGLYLISDAADLEAQTLIAEALRGGARILQYRDKRRAPHERLEVARRLRDLCREAKALFIVNDSPELARDCNADGVHLGQGDAEVGKARRLLGPDKLIGVSTRTVEQALKAQSQGADYIGLGSMYPTASKDDAVVVGVETLRRVRKAVEIPIVAIGGIDRERTAELIAAGADAVAVISAIAAAAEPALAAREIAVQFNARDPFPRGRVLTAAGSDSGGGAGIQADLKTITLLGAYGTSAITALTAQNTLGVRAIHPAPANFVAEQLAAILEDIGTDTLKTGMLFNADIVAVVSRAIHRYNPLAVVDPVMVAKGGAALLEQDAVDAVRELLLPETYLLTPNLPEAEVLCGSPVRNLDEMEAAARKLRAMGARNVLIKGGHLAGDAVDLLLEGERLHRLSAARVDTRNTHGTGCTFSAAIATFLAQGRPLVQAVGAAKDFISTAIATARPLGAGHGPVNHWQAAQTMRED
ncbi:bifunctional hydroxymethylpyrimidine kinase/phosphomethylpyrimidine kinase [Geoalkalibacter halelectricus]|uniref:Thiamine-phosphate synthase n=1 Tax=Geoalkalibacter halelectricus TaxID=2847045 RepID=A0ABY5ZN32_9BACT|nr:bifunctional hydroxymethylpyrimidine kinase/phosphomethylpyrimidine kinase [Geoalkalibacter halelectricus]MDO3378790.1 bifunctional hydroxymethylpyrimidine kinase/phosphomethylpyrimidine kinase [Geoalkalibacter halelectricus]UWZ79904.1 bifunctional hydroxymethylpyrimidine kinase/phosphomethylpyrimidine kinase [Geoalkalibacter halelectricus]